MNLPINKHIEMDTLTQFRLLKSLQMLREGYQVDPETDYDILDQFIDYLNRSRLLEGPATPLVYTQKEAEKLTIGST